MALSCRQREDLTGKGRHGRHESNEMDSPVTDLRGVVGPLGVGAEHAHDVRVYIFDLNGSTQ